MGPLKDMTSSDDEHHEVEDDSTEENNMKTLKKARFKWQIKGNYHLKNNNHEVDAQVSPGRVPPESSASISMEPSSSALDTAVCEPSESLPQTPRPCNHHQQNSEPSTENSSNAGIEPLLMDPLRQSASGLSCVVCDTYNESNGRTCVSIIGERITSPLPSTHPDWNVKKWQARQMAKAFMDNTVNSILDAMGFSPVPESAPDSDPDDVLASVNFPQIGNDSHEEEEEDESVENEGILSAIQRHGLQRHTLQPLPEESNPFCFAASSSSRSSPSPIDWESTKQVKYRSFYQSGNRSCTVESFTVDSHVGLEYLEQNLSVSVNREDKKDPPINIKRALHKVCGETSNPSSSACQCDGYPRSICEVAHQKPPVSLPISSNCLQPDFDSSDEEDWNSFQEFKKSTQSVAPILTKELSTELADQKDDGSKKRTGSDDVCLSSMLKRKCLDSVDEDSKSSSASASQSRSSPGVEESLVSITAHSNDRKSPTFGHFEFMDAAVAAAIQKKGLSALACQDL